VKGIVYEKRLFPDSARKGEQVNRGVGKRRGKQTVPKLGRPGGPQAVVHKNGQKPVAKKRWTRPLGGGH